MGTHFILEVYFDKMMKTFHGQTDTLLISEINFLRWAEKDNILSTRAYLWTMEH